MQKSIKFLLFSGLCLLSINLTSMNRDGSGGNLNLALPNPSPFLSDEGRSDQEQKKCCESNCSSSCRSKCSECCSTCSDTCSKEKNEFCAEISNCSDNCKWLLKNKKADIALTCLLAGLTPCIHHYIPGSAIDIGTVTAFGAKLSSLCRLKSKLGKTCKVCTLLAASYGAYELDLACLSACKFSTNYPQAMGLGSLEVLWPKSATDDSVRLSEAMKNPADHIVKTEV